MFRCHGFNVLARQPVRRAMQLGSRDTGASNHVTGASSLLHAFLLASCLSADARMQLQFSQLDALKSSIEIEFSCHGPQTDK